MIDDRPINLEALAALLRREGFDAIFVESPRSLEAMIAQAEQIDIIFLDLEFPNYSGFDILATLQADPRLEGVPIVAYTVHVSEQNEARTAGFHSFIGKPLDVSRFPDQLRRIMNGERVWEVR
jgi:two-component system cell cycle response regulator DivK